MLPALGFDEDQIADVHATFDNASQAMTKCLASCRQNDSAFKREFERWFRERSEDNEPSVKLLVWTVEQMHDRFTAGGKQLVVSLCDDWDIMQNDYGNVDSFSNKLARTESRPGKPARPATNLQQKINSYYASGAVATIRLAPSVFILPRVASEGVSQLVVFLHELSHWAAGTRDLKQTSKAVTAAGTTPEKCYGISTGVRWAVDRGKYLDGVMRAIQNADSVAYFVASFL